MTKEQEQAVRELREAARYMDWQQVVLNGGPPCFHLCDDKRFCGRAERWAGHNDLHKFVPLESLITLLEQAQRERDHLRKAAQLALDWCTGRGEFADGKYTYEQLAETVAPALEKALKIR